MSRRTRFWIILISAIILVAAIVIVGLIMLRPTVLGSLQAERESHDIGLSYSVAVDKDVFQHTTEEDTDRYTDTTDPSGDTYFEVRLIRGTTAAELAPSFLDSYIDFQNIEFAGSYEVGNTGLVGKLITADNDNVKLEAYLLDQSEGTLAIVLSYSAETKDAQLNRLYDVLDSLTIE